MAMIRTGWSIANPLVGTVLLSACLLACDSNDSSNPSSGAAIEDASRRDVMMPQAMDAFVLGDAGPEPVQDAGNGPRPDGWYAALSVPEPSVQSARSISSGPSTFTDRMMNGPSRRISTPWPSTLATPTSTTVSS